MEPTFSGAPAGASTLAPSHAQLALRLASRLCPAQEGAANAALDDLASELRGADALPAREQIAEVFLTMEPLRTLGTGISPDDLRVDRVLERGAGHPLALTAIALDISRRAGLDLGVAAHGGGHVVAHRRVAEPMGLDFGRDGEDRIRALPIGPLAWRSPHELGSEIVAELVERGVRGGDIGLALRAAEATFTMPLDPGAAQAARVRLGALRATLN